MNVPEFHTPDFVKLPSETAIELQSWNRELGFRNREFELLAEEKAGFSNGTLDIVEDELPDTWHTWGARMAESLRLAVKHLRKLAPLLDAIEATCQSERDKAIATLDQARVDVRRKLKGIGYLDLDVFDPNPSKIIPGDIEKHPAVLAARHLAADLMSYCQTITARRIDTENRIDEAITKLRARVAVAQS